MQLGIGKTVFPSWSASLELVSSHGANAVLHARDAVKAQTGAERLDHAVLAMTSFDHAIDQSSNLPVKWFIGGSGTYYRGYAAAKAAVDLLVGSGVIPGAKERVGHQSLVAAKDSFLEGVQASNTENGRYGMHLAGGWLEATAEDALQAVRLLDNGQVGRELLAGIGQARTVVRQRRELDETLVRAVTDLFDRSIAQLGEQAGSAANAPVVAATSGWDAIARSAVLLDEAAVAAQQLVDDAHAARVHVDAAVPAAG